MNTGNLSGIFNTANIHYAMQISGSEVAELAGSNEIRSRSVKAQNIKISLPIL
jgi:hypothetical protein